MRKRFVVLGVAGTAAMMFVANQFAHWRADDSARSMAAVLRQVEEIGELRTARHNYTQVYRHETSAGAQGIAAGIPGLDQVSRSMTRNHVLMEVVATVDAGVDLRKAELVTSPSGDVTIKLPAVEIYRPMIDARVFDEKRGLLWRDPNIATSAISAVQRDMAVRARLDGIRKEAEQNAISRLRSLVPGAREATIEFESHGPVS